MLAIHIALVVIVIVIVILLFRSFSATPLDTSSATTSHSKRDVFTKFRSSVVNVTAYFGMPDLAGTYAECVSLLLASLAWSKCSLCSQW